MEETNNINWEERRFIAAAIILSDMCANYAHSSPSPFRAKDAVWLADKLIRILSRPPVLKNIKDNSQHTNQL